MNITKKAKNTIFIFLPLMLTFLSMSYASSTKTEIGEEKNPLGCRDLGYEFKLKVLHLQPAEVGATQSLYFIYNRSYKPISLYQMLKDESTQSMFLNHVIHARQWAVLSTSQKELKYICTVDDGKSNYGKIVNCADNLKVCEYARVKYGLNNAGNFWLVDSSRGGAVQEVLRYGIIPR